jgi:hypothetical protein
MGDFSPCYFYAPSTLSWRQVVTDAVSFLLSAYICRLNGPMWMLTRGYVNKLYGKTPIDLRMGFRPLQPTLLAYPSLSLRHSVSLRLILSFSQVVNRVNLKTGSRHNLNVSTCSEILLILMTPLYGLLHKLQDPWTTSGSNVNNKQLFQPLSTLWWRSFVGPRTY